MKTTYSFDSDDIYRHLKGTTRTKEMLTNKSGSLDLAFELLQEAAANLISFYGHSVSALDMELADEAHEKAIDTENRLFQLAQSFHNDRALLREIQKREGFTCKKPVIPDNANSVTEQ